MIDRTAPYSEHPRPRLPEVTICHTLKKYYQNTLGKIQKFQTDPFNGIFSWTTSHLLSSSNVLLNIKESGKVWLTALNLFLEENRPDPWG